MALISPVQIQGGKKLFSDVSEHTVKIDKLERNFASVTTIIEDKIKEDKSEIKSSIMDLYNKVTNVYALDVDIEEEGQTSFNLNLSEIEDKEISDAYPIKLIINGISYYEPSFSLDFDNGILTWLDENFEIDNNDNIKLEIPLKNLQAELIDFEENFENAFSILNYLISIMDDQDATIDDSHYYIKFIKNVGMLPQSIILNGDKIEIDQNFTLNLGEHIVVNKRYYKIKDDDLYLAAPVFLSYYRDVTAEINNIDFVYNNNKVKLNRENYVEINSIEKIGNNLDHNVTYEKSEVINEYDLTEARRYGTSYLGYTLEYDHIKIPVGTPYLIKKSFSDDEPTVFAITKVLDNTYSASITNYYSSGVIENPVNRMIKLTLLIPNYGYVSINIDVTED